MNGPPLRRGQPVWLPATNGKSKQSYPPLRGLHEADVAIVGGGMTGALIAHAFATAGVSVVLLEAARVGRGSTAASSALLLQEPDQGMAQLARRYGPASSRRIWQLTHEAVRDFVATFKRLRIACDLVKRDAVYYATNAEAAARLRAEFILRTKAGFDGDWLTPGTLRRLTGIPGHGAILTSGNAQFDPVKACLGLLRAAKSSGARIFERSEVTRITRLGDRVRVRTRTGSVEASRVVIATGYATTHFRPLAGRFRLYRTYVLATQPLNDSQRRELGLGKVMVWDTDRPYHYARWTPDNRLLLGGGDRPVRVGERRDTQFTAATRQLRDDFQTRLPALSDIEIHNAWEGLFAMTPDSLPFIGSHQRYPRHFFALGYGGNGMTFGCLAARMLLEQWQGIRSADHRLFRFGRLR
jgi:glycine/D-amino acid oxidase-like deaminating enzyme